MGGANREGHVVYVLQAANGLLKFGSTRDLRARISNLQTMAPDPLVLVAWAPGGRVEEAQLQLRLVDHVHHGEWFVPSAEVVRVVRYFRRIVGAIRWRARGESSWSRSLRARVVLRDFRRARAGGVR